MNLLWLEVFHHMTELSSEASEPENFAVLVFQRRQKKCLGKAYCMVLGEGLLYGA